ncbi:MULTISPECIES: CAF17-like 4Fe-4S cluster assembly/insertion protein YgfZ [Dietzia]|uniref:CAF17-like 4Fe-4S cluster assembly/insertion protein YgfZ n=3 Tax=Dietziaceae TaxID=85029 RepID=UPI0015CE4004|nr:folate-binding protein YgfZ [Dietzia cercidiphylli]MBB1035272.1 folate-binding protein YgfZ [Dietzia sp. CQ4]MBB1040916.1 folate-binding protein YgfZ [Dietzia sp. Cai40]MBC7294870.1 folate-binding protein YgfZ [Dietzia sp.]MCT1517130.1 folate-binding protein [Dietzia cercidiphylli]
MTVPAVPDRTDNGYHSPILTRPGAVDTPGPGPDAGVPFHYGDPFGEQRTATTSVVVVDRSHRDVLTIGGGERLSWLEGFVSQHVSELEDRSGGETLILDANGRVEHHVVLSDVDGTLVMDTEPGRGAALLTFLTRMVFWADATPEAADLVVVTLAGTGLPGALTAPDGTMVELPVGDYASVPLPGGGIARRMPWPLAGSVDLLVPRAGLTGWFDAAVRAGARPAGSWAFEALRAVETDPLRARLGVDTDEKTIPHEIPTWIGEVAQRGAVHLDKGCYRGQETVSRVHNLGKSPRVLVRLHLDGSGGDQSLSPGAEVLAGGRTVGRVGTVVQHHEYGPVALALLKRSVPSDTVLEVDGVSAAIDPDSVPHDSGPQAGREAIRRLRGQA